MSLDEFALFIRSENKYCWIVYAEYSFLVSEDDYAIYVNVYSKLVSNEILKIAYLLACLLGQPVLPKYGVSS